MADVTIEATASSVLDTFAARGGIFWTSASTGYVIYVDSLADLKYRKTVDGGATWAAAVNIRTGIVIGFDCWADWQTVGDSGTKIHIGYTDRQSNDVRYVCLDTNGDSISGDVQLEACQGTGTMHLSSGRSNYQLSITKTRGGNLAMAYFYPDNAAAFFYSFYTSPDAITWTSKTTPFENARDPIQIYPGNEADNQDLWAAFWDISADAISLKTFDNSGNSWSEQAISAAMYEEVTYNQMDGQVRLSDGHLIFAAWDRYDHANATLKVWDINGAGSITAKTNVKTNAPEYFLVSVFIDQSTDDIYIAYIGGTAILSLVKVFYQKSADGGANWGGEAAMQADAEEDMRWVSAGAMKVAWGGKFQPFWFDDDDDDLFTNTDNGISIAGTAAGLENKSANMGAKMIAGKLI